MNKKVVYVFSDIPYDEFADYVRCANCDIEMLVPCGMEKCPICGEEGMTMWVNDDEQEVNVEQFLYENEFVETDSKYFPFTHKILVSGKEDNDGCVSIPLDFYHDEKHIVEIFVSRNMVRPEILFDINGAMFSEDIKDVDAYDFQLMDKIKDKLTID